MTKGSFRRRADGVPPGEETWDASRPGPPSGTGVGQRIAALSAKKRDLLLRHAGRLGVKLDDRAIRARGRDTSSFPLSFAQLRKWFLEELEPGNPDANLHGGLVLKGPLKVTVLVRALGELVRRHEALRTVFAAADGEPRQVILPGLGLEVPVCDLGALARVARRVELRRLTGERAARPFDLARGPLLRATLVRLGHERHAVILVMHHIVSDGWSMGVFYRELEVLYEAFSRDLPSPLPALEIQYADFAVWQRDWLRGDVLERQLSYWRQSLAGAPDVLELPFDRPRPAQPTLGGGTVLIELSQSTTEGLKALGQRHGATLFMTLLTAFDVLLLKYTGQHDLVVGTPIANRNRPELEGIFGFFVNTLVLRTDVGGDPSCLELLSRVVRSTVGAYEHQDLPFERLVEELDPERDLSRQALFQVMFQLQNAPVATPDFAGLTLEPLEIELHTASFDATLSFLEHEGLYGVWQYSTDLFDRSTVWRMARHFRTLVEGLLQAPAARLSQLPLLSAAERQQLVVEWNDGENAAARQPCLVHQLPAAQATRRPDAVAVRGGAWQLSYAELDRQADRLAHRLIALGVTPESRVGISMERSPEMMVAVLACLKAGAACVPLDPEHPESRLATILDNSGLAMILTQERLRASLSGTGTAVVPVDRGEARHPGTARPASVHSDQLVYVLYTSGSTGRPKGVALSHRVLANLISWHEGSGSCLDHRAVTLQFTSLSFDVAFQEIFSTWAGGGTLVLVAEDVRRDFGRLLTHLAEHRVERLFLPFVALNHLAAAAERSDGPLTAALREIVTAGEQLRTTPQVVALFRRLTGCRLYNHYGPAETHVVTAFALAREVERWQALPPIGHPVAQTQVHLLDRTLRAVPPGVPGEIAIGGLALSRGYFGRPRLSAERFVPDPFASGGRLYRTGDLARWRRDGDLEFLGRNDLQVKIRGFRVEPGEVEAHLSRHPGVRDCVVAADRGDNDAHRLLAYLVTEPELSVGDRELRRFLQAKLPDYMVPAVFIRLPSLPQTPTGKVDRRALPAPLADRGATGIHGAPRTPVEDLLAGIWAEVLGHGAPDRLGTGDSFFELGGHSLLATQVISRIRGVFGVELAVRTLFETPTLGGLAEQVEAERRAERGLAIPALRPLSRDVGGMPLSFAQRRLWFLEQLRPGTATYNLPLALHLRGRLDVAVLERCFSEIVRRHEVLRTTFTAGAGEPLQVVHRPRYRRLSGIDVSRLAPARRSAESLALVTSQARRPFDLARGPLLRVTLLYLEPCEHILLLNMHHIVSDGWSTSLLLRELTELYRALTEGRPAALAPLRLQYADFAIWQRDWLRGEVLEQQISSWTRRLTDVAPLELATDRPRPAVQTTRGGQRVRHLQAELWSHARAFCRRSGATPFMLLLAIFAALLRRYTGQTQVVVGSPIANRNREEVEELIGFFVNNLVLPTDFAGGPSLRQLLDQVRATTLDAYAHQDLPFEILVEKLEKQRDLSSHPLFQVMLAFQNAPMPATELPELTLSPVNFATGVAKFDLTLLLIEDGGGLVTVLEYNTDLFDPTTVERLLGHLEILLAGGLAGPDRRLEELELCSVAERHQLLGEWNDTAVSLPAAPIHVLFAAEVARRAEATALVAGDERLSYGELARRAHRLAHCLRRLGVGPDVPVGLCLERSPELIVGLLGILAAGGAYLPLDPSYPAERLAFMLADARAPVVLTRRRERELLPEPAVGVRYLDLGAELPAVPDEAPAAEVSPSHLAYVTYTSGSTGRPKGVAIRHRAVVRLVRGTNYVRLDEEQVFLQLAPVAFDASTLEIWGALLNGGQLVLMPPGTPSLDDLAGVLGRHRINVLWLTAGFFHQMVEGQLAGLAGVGQLLAGGDVLSSPHVRRVLQEFGRSPGGGQTRGCRMINGYGPTENTTFTCCHSMSEPSQVGSSVSIGRPVSNTRVTLLDTGFRPVPIGVPGELCIAGHGLALGYCDRPRRTAGSFVPNPSGFPLGSRLYRTGDLARFLSDGRLEFLGRRDLQVKVRGYRIELGEIETVLASHPAIAEVVVTTYGKPPADRTLVAYLVAADDAALPAVEELRAFVGERLPSYMAPGAFVPLDALPLTENGKVDRRALPDPRSTRLALKAEFVVASNELEKTLAGIWRQVLEVDDVGVDDNFFDLGGHSLKIVQVHQRLQENLGRELALLELFEHPTVRSLAIHLSRDASAVEVPETGASADAGTRQIEDMKRGRSRLRRRRRSGSPPQGGCRGEP